MTFVHIALFRWKQDADRSAVDEALQTIEELATKVPGVIEIATAENSSRYSEGYSHVVLVRADSQAAIDAYRVHPEHQSAAAIIEAAEEHGIGVDFNTRK